MRDYEGIARSMLEDWLPEEGACYFCQAPALMLRSRNADRANDFVYCQVCDAGYYDREDAEQGPLGEQSWDILDTYLTLAAELGFWTQEWTQAASSETLLTR